MTDNEIVKALECCVKDGLVCPMNCPGQGIDYDWKYECRISLMKIALDLINRQKAEIEKYENIKTTIDEFWDILLKIKIAKRKEKPTLEELAEAIEEIETEAITEFAERLKELSYLPNLSLTNMEVVDIAIINNLVKEMTE